jgi:hypothetical protein
VPRVGDAAAFDGAALTRDQLNRKFIVFRIRLYRAIDLALQGCAGRALHHHMERTECGRVSRQRRVVGHAVDQWSGAAQHSRDRCASVYDLVRRPLGNSNDQQNPDGGVSDTNANADTNADTNADADSNTCAGTRTDTNTNTDASSCTSACANANSDADTLAGTGAHTVERREYARRFQCAVR